MLAEERQRLTLQLLHRYGEVLVSDLAEQLHVSDETIRRDINALQNAGLARRVHGGAVLPRENLQEAGYRERALTNPDAKRQIGAIAASLVEDGDSILIGHGATTDTIAPALTARHLTVVTTSIVSLNLLLAALQQKQTDASLLFLGGNVDLENRSVHGALTERQLSSLSIDKAFIGATAIDSDGVHMYHQDENALSQIMIRRSSRIYVLAERAKLEKRALYKTCDLDEVHHLITDTADGLSSSFKQALQDAGIQLHCTN